jgi:hypothetical protein
MPKFVLTFKRVHELAEIMSVIFNGAPGGLQPASVNPPLSVFAATCQKVKDSGTLDKLLVKTFPALGTMPREILSTSFRPTTKIATPKCISYP